MVFLRQPAGPREAGDVGNILGARTAARFLVSADEKRPQPCAAPREEDPDPLRGIQLVPGEGEEIDLSKRTVQVERHLPRGLRGIRKEEDRWVGLFGQPRQIRHREDHAGLVVGVHHRYEECFARAQGARQRPRIAPSRMVHRQEIDIESAACQVLCDLIDRRMLHRGRDQVPAPRIRAHGAVDRGVHALGGAGGEEHFLQSRAAEERRHRFPRLPHGPRCRLRPLVDRARVEVLGGQKRQHRLQHLRRDGGGGVVVEVNGAVVGHGAQTAMTRILGSTVSLRTCSTVSFMVKPAPPHPAQAPVSRQ